MDCTRIRHRQIGRFLLLAAFLACGCQTVHTPEEKIAASNLPTELSKTSLPPYVVEPPDLLIVEVLETLPGRPISGERLVRPDGTVSLGFYGDVYVTGLTLDQIKAKIVLHLRHWLTDNALGLYEEDPSDGKQKLIAPEKSSAVFVDVGSYNSKMYYVQGDVVVTGRFPITGNEDVLSAINAANGLMPTAAPSNIRLVRPAPPGACCEQILPINLAAIISGGDTTTNYQLMPGDRIVVYRDPIVRATVFIDRLAAPFQTVLNSMLQYGFTARTVKSISTPLFGNGTATTGARAVQPGAQ